MSPLVTSLHVTCIGFIKQAFNTKEQLAYDENNSDFKLVGMQDMHAWMLKRRNCDYF